MTVIDWAPYERYPLGGSKWPVFQGCPEHATDTALARTLLLPWTVIVDVAVTTGIVTVAVTYGGLVVVLDTASYRIREEFIGDVGCEGVSSGEEVLTKA